MSFLIFPTQLFYDTSHLDGYETVYLIEEPRYFTDFSFHKLKLAYHRATMKKYETYLQKKYHVKYIEYNKVDDFYKKIDDVTYMSLPDHSLEKKLKRFKKIENKNFLVKDDELDTIKTYIYNKTYSHEKFYKYQRTKLDILMKDGKPIKKWSFDTENRLPLPKSDTPPELKPTKKNKYIKEAISYVTTHFPDNNGSLDFFYPIDHKSARLWLHTFLEERLSTFGKYQDAVSEKSPFVYHSVISPMMNIGLLTDEEVVNVSYDYYKKHDIPIESYEGFIRQVIGWRNYMYTIYLLEGEEMYESNMLQHTTRLSSHAYNKLWKGETDIVPIDSIIHKIGTYAYAHHIERLMYLGNFLLLCMIDPKDVYKMFMEWTIDAYDWVMVPNVMGMSQYASPIMTKRPYFSSTNYITKMSTYKKDGTWDIVWNALYYHFIDRHADLLRKNYAIARQVYFYEKKSKKEKDEIKKIASFYLRELNK